MSTSKVIIVGATAVALLTSSLPVAAEAHGLHVGWSKAGVHGARLGAKAEGLTGRVALGTITGVSSSTLTLALKSSKNASTTPLMLTVNTTASTTIMKDGQTATLADLATGEMAIVSGTRTSTTTLDASRIFVRTKGKAFGWLRVK